MLYYGIWGGILSHNVDIRVGHVICRQLGYSRAERILRYPSFGRVIGPLWIWSIQCNGNEIEISQCKVETWDKIWKISWYHRRYYGRYYQQRPRNAASLLCSKENSSLSKGKLRWWIFEKTAFFSTAVLKGDRKIISSPAQKKDIFTCSWSFSKKYIKFKMRPKIKWTNSTKHYKTSGFLKVNSEQWFSGWSKRWEGDIECPEMSLTAKHNS